MNIKLIVLSSIAFFLSLQCIDAQIPKEAEGYWRARGYGWLAELRAETIKVYDVSNKACLPNAEYPVSVFSEGIFVNGSVLTLKRGLTRYTFDRIEKLPALCERKLTNKERSNPVFNFEVLWHTFNEQYAYFSERNIDWHQIYDRYRGRIDAKTNDVELFAVCRAMLKELNDGHVSIQGPTRIMKRAMRIESTSTKPKADMSGARRAVVAKYLKNPKHHNISRTIWDKINDSIGYMQVNSMAAQGDYGITETTSVKEAQKQYRDYLKANPYALNGDVDGMKKIMVKVMEDLGETDKIILDVRFNGGGEDLVGLEILKHFVSTKKTIFHKKERMGPSFSEPYSFELSTAGDSYSGELYILQSHYSASATEVLLLSSMAYDNVTRLGSPSKGVFSDILEKKLPNGWGFGLSNQIYFNTDGVSYESKGIPVDVDFDYSKDRNLFAEQLKKNVKTTGDTAIEYILQAD